MRVFAAGHPTNRLTIEVTWRNDTRSVIQNVQPNHHYEISEQGATTRTADETSPQSTPSAPFFADVSSILSHSHHEEPFDDLARQPSLPIRHSQLGPGVSWFDVDGDSWDDLIIASGRGGRTAIYRNQRDGSFTPWTRPILSQPVTRDQTTVLAWSPSGRQTELLAGSANYEDGLPVGSTVRRYPLDQNIIDDSFPGSQSSVGPLALADYDGDGELDLFVGGRVIPGRYPEPASSFLYHGRNGRLELDQTNSATLARVGLVSGAVWTDLTGNGWPDLALACEWGPIRIFTNHQGTLRETTDAWGLSAYRGWWNGIAAGDFNGDGRMDLVASNAGRNTRYEPYRQQPIRIYYGDFFSTGTIAFLESYFDPLLQQFVPWRSLESVATSIPTLRDQFETHSAFAQANVKDILSEFYDSARTVEAQWSETSLLINHSNHFTVHPLPIEAQFAPSFGVTIGDLDGDGHEDVFLSQNLFAVHPEDSPSASGTGLWLTGDNQGNLTPVPAQHSGIRIHGEQRACALADFDHDGRVDLVVTQNGYETKLFRNLAAKPGLRVRLAGPPGNPHGIGASIRLIYPHGRGPAREIHAGSGYWSQNSTVQVMGLAGSPTRVWVRWPGGAVAETSVAEAAREVHVDQNGQLK
jgi:hypothetical protein